ncbi:MAG: ABC transporter permease subunit [Blautia sp.]|nr:ABC transporter permease subunit [Blautia sp.]
MSKNYELYLFVLPAFVVLVIFNYIPIYGLQIAFKDFVPSKGIAGSEWTGLKHFMRFVSGYQFENLMANTFVLALQVIFFTFPIPVLFALVVNQLKNGWKKNMIQTISYMPHFISTVVIAGMLLVFLSPRSGIVNIIISWLGGEKINFMGMASWFRPLYIISEIWQHMGWESIVFVAALSSVDPTYYEAAKMDGAGRFKRMLYIDLPMLLPTMIIVFILKVGYVTSAGGSAMSPVFEKVFLMQNDLNLSTSEVIATYVYKIGLKSQQYSYSAAIGLFNTLISFSLVAVMNKIGKKTTGAGLW